MSCSLCSYVCIGLPGPAHPPKVKYSLKAIFVVSVERSNTAYNSLHIDCIGFMSWVSERSNTAYNSLHIDCIGFMLWVSKDQTQHVVSVERSNTAYNSLHIDCIGFMSCSLCSYVCIGLPGPAHPPKVKYSLKLLLWLALSARMCVLACQDQHTLPKWNILSSCYCGLLSLLVCVYWPIFVVSVERSNTAYNSLHIDCIGFMLWVSKDQTQHTIVYT